MAMNFSGSQQRGFNPSPVQLTGGGNNSPATAASNVNVAGTFKGVRDASPRFDQISAESMKNRSMERQAAMQAESQVASAGIQAFGQAQSANIAGQYNLAAAEAQASATKSAAGMQAMGSIVSAGIGLLGSDERVKRQIHEIEDAVATLKKLRPVHFHYKHGLAVDPEREHSGFIAQELRQVLPGAVHQSDEDGMLCVELSDLFGLLTRAVQQLDERIEKIESNPNIWRF